jgi:hypothetical protein
MLVWKNNYKNRSQNPLTAKYAKILRKDRKEKPD